MAHLMNFVKTTGYENKSLLCSVHRLGIRRLCFGSTQSFSAQAVTLLSGSLSFLCKQFELSCQQCTVGVVDHHFTGRLRNGVPPGNGHLVPSNVSWHRLRHLSFGGPTKFVTLVGVTATTWSPPSDLRRTVRHVVDFKVKPKFCHNQPNFTASTVHRYSLDDRLIPGKYNHVLCYPTHFFMSGWGQRCLELSELGAAHGYSRVVLELGIDPRFLNFPLLQVLSSILGTFSATRGSASILAPPRHLVLGPSTDNSSATWFPVIARSLPNSWIDSSNASS
jgi:hypothetical protein